MASPSTAVVPRNPLEELGEEHEPTKRMHDYLRHYWTHFRDMRQTVRTVLEIGVQTGRSLRMWADFFPGATIHGLDLDSACKAHEDDRIRIHIGDQGDPAFLRQLRDEIGEADIIIDDGSHVADHQILSFESLFPMIRGGGCYVIEDIGAHPGRSRTLTFDRVRELVGNINYWPRGFPGEKWPELNSFPDDATYYDRNVVGLAIYRYIAFVLKGRNPEDNRYLSR